MINICLVESNSEYHFLNILERILIMHHLYFKVFNKKSEMINDKVKDKNYIKILVLSDSNYTKENLKDIKFEAILFSPFAKISNHLNFQNTPYLIDMFPSNIKNPKLITYGFDNSSHISLSAITEMGYLNKLQVCINQNFTSLFSTNMIKYEFSMCTNTFDANEIYIILKSR